MKHWWCPKCNKERFYNYGSDEKLIMKICLKCNTEMEVRKDGY
jgi:DNA polymerase III alpha subunit (gram-positive type)